MSTSNHRVAVTSNNLTAVSLFAGIGGIDLAMERAGITVTAACEIDKAARSVLERRFPKTTLFSDARELTADDIIDTGFCQSGILAAGWPCQGNSVAGHRQGMADPRSGLWREVARLLAELRPRWFVGENVPGLLSVRGGADFRQVLQDLDGLGYGVAWRVLDAQHFGVPQRRRRVLVAGCLGDPARAAQVLLEPEGSAGDSAQGREAGEGIAGTIGASTGGTEPQRAGAYVVTGCLTEGTMTDYDDNTARAGLMVTAHHTSGAGWWTDGVGTLRSEGGGGTPEQVVVSTLQGGGKRGYRVDAEAAAGGHLIYNPYRTMIAKGDYVEGFKPDVIHDALTANPPPKGPPLTLAYSLTTRQERNDLEQTWVCSTGVRRLTPLECERLQGFPDGWTEGQSDSARYRQLGNAVAVPVLEWLMQRIAAC